MRRLLIVTQKLDQNDGVLGFFHEWVEHFAKHWQSVTVISLGVGSHTLPSNVRVFSLGKENRLGRLRYFFNFYKYIWQFRNTYDAVFVHMNPRYIILGWPVWRAFQKTIALWYAHGHVPFTLRMADYLTDIGFTSTPEGYRLLSHKRKIVGQGINTDKFFPVTNRPRPAIFKIVTIGRITPAKDYETLIKAIAFLSDKNKLVVEIVGGGIQPADTQYLGRLRQLVKERKLEQTVKFIGMVANKNVVPILQSADLFVNMGQTGSLDKANLEAMACGVLILTCNEAFTDVLGDNYRDRLMYPKKDFQQLAKKIELMLALTEEERVKITQDLRAIVVQQHNLTKLIQKITEEFNHYA